MTPLGFDDKVKKALPAEIRVISLNNPTVQSIEYYDIGHRLPNPQGLHHGKLTEAFLNAMKHGKSCDTSWADTLRSAQHYLHNTNQK